MFYWRKNVTPQFLCIDLKSFFASVECVERGMDPMKTNLVVADPDRGDGTICLAVSPSMKALGVKNRCRVYEIPRGIPYIKATPQMQKYVDYSVEINRIYRSFLADGDVSPYSIDESFLEVTRYLNYYKKSAKEIGIMIMNEITRRLGLRAACGIGTNLYLTKIALDITAKHAPDFIGELDEERYRRDLWDHRPLTDFWQIGGQTAAKLEKYGLCTMGAIAAAPRDFLHRLFGVLADDMINHAWGLEPLTLKNVKEYVPKSKSLSSGQILPRDYTYDEALVVLREMADNLSFDLAEKGFTTDSLTVDVGYSAHAGLPPEHGTASLPHPTSSDLHIIPAVVSVYVSRVKHNYPIRRLNICCNRVRNDEYRQFSLFEDPLDSEEHRRLRLALLGIRRRYGKNAVLRGADYLPAATARERNAQLGGHKR